MYLLDEIYLENDSLQNITVLTVNSVDLPRRHVGQPQMASCGVGFLAWETLAGSLSLKSSVYSGRGDDPREVKGGGQIGT